MKIKYTEMDRIIYLEEDLTNTNTKDLGRWKGECTENRKDVVHKLWRKPRIYDAMYVNEKILR